MAKPSKGGAIAYTNPSSNNSNTVVDHLGSFEAWTTQVIIAAITTTVSMSIASQTAAVS